MRRKSSESLICYDCRKCAVTDDCLWYVRSSTHWVNRHINCKDYKKVVKLMVQKKPLLTFGEVNSG